MSTQPRGGPFGGALGRLAGLPRIQLWATGASVAWAAIVLAYAIGFWSVAASGQGRGTLFLDAMFFLLTLAVPLLLVWLAAFLAAELARQRELIAALAGVAAPLLEGLAATRDALERQSPTAPEALHRAVEAAVSGLVRPSDITGPLDRLAAGQSRLQLVVDRIAAPQPKRTRTKAPEPSPEPAAAETVVVEPDPEPEAQAAPDGQAELPLLGEEPARPDWATLVRALDFPRDPDDRDGFRALKAALRHHGLAQVLQSAEDVLNLLSQEGVFVDDLAMEPVDVTAWRRFMAGVRGPEIAGLGGIADPKALEVARNLMRSDSIFRDSSLFFQRRFDRVLAEFGREASDAATRRARRDALGAGIHAAAAAERVAGLISRFAPRLTSGAPPPSFADLGYTNPRAPACPRQAR